MELFGQPAKNLSTVDFCSNESEVQGDLFSSIEENDVFSKQPNVVPIIRAEDVAFRILPLDEQNLGSKPISQPILALYRELAKTDMGLAEISGLLCAHKDEQIEKGLFSQNIFTLEGSSTEGVVQDPNTGIKKKAILWCINHYTGLNRDVRVISAAQNALEKYGTGSGTSAMSCGYSALHKELEARLAALVGKEEALFFPTGYTTNLGVISALASKGDIVIFDRESHASIIDGIKLSGSTFISFRHNDVADLKRKLVSTAGKFRNVFVVVESAYSMSGDIAPILDICTLKEVFKFYLYVDEAHTFGIYGSSGAGLSKQLGVTENVDFLMSTLSKSTASVGGFVACDRKYRALIEWAANAYIFQAAGSPGDVAAILESLKILESDDSIAKTVHTNNLYMRNKLIQRGFVLGDSQSPVIPIFINDDQKLLEASMKLLDLGVFTVSVVYPAVKRGNGRLRFIVTARHTVDQIDYTVNALEKIVF